MFIIESAAGDTLRTGFQSREAAESERERLAPHLPGFANATIEEK